MDELNEIDRWTAAGEARQDEIARAVLARLPGWEWAAADTFPAPDGKDNAPPLRMVSLREQATGLVFQLIPGGAFPMGCSAVEIERIRAVYRQDPGEEPAPDAFDAWGPVHTVRVPPFLLMREVLTADEAGALLGRDPEEWREECLGTPALWHEDIKAVLQRTGNRLPSEAEWEYGCRGGVPGRLFAHGNAIPDGNEWVTGKGYEPWGGHQDWTPENVRRASNRFGLVGMGAWAEICADLYRDGYHGAPTDGSPRLDPPDAGEEPSHVTRGHGAYCYPWQGVGEWQWLLCAARLNEGGVSDMGFNVRLARSLIAVR